MAFMNYWMLFAEIPAAVAASVMFINLMPFSLDKKLNPWVMFLAALLVLFLPAHIVLAMAMTVPMGLVYGWTGIRLQGHEPVKLPVEQIKKIAKRLRVSKKVAVTEFLTQEFPNPSVESYVPPL